MSKRQRELRQRHYTDAKEVAADRDKGFVSKAYKVPDGMSVFRWTKERTYKLDIVSYKVGEGNPAADEGMYHYERTYYVHRDVGPSKDTVLCNAKTFGERCYPCEHRDRLLADPESNKKLTDAIKHKERQLMLVRDHDELEKGWQILDTAYYKSFGELLDSKCKAGDDDMPFHHFHHPEGGFILKVLVEEDTFNGKKYFKPTNIEMVPRKKPISEEVIDSLPCLDDLLIKQDYKTLKKLFLQTPEEDEDEEDEEDSELEEDDKPAKKGGKKGKKVKDDDEEDEDDAEDDEDAEEDEDESEGDSDEDEEDDNGDEVEFSKGDKVSGSYKNKKFKGKVVKLVNGLIQVKTEDGDLRTMDPDELKLLSSTNKDDEEEDDPKPKSGKTSKTSSPDRSKKKGKNVKDEDDEDDDEEELDLEDDE